MKINSIKTQQILDFEKEIGRQLVVNERKDKSLPRYYVHFRNSEIQDGILLRAGSGDGNTVNAALRDYAKSISNKILVLDAFSNFRREILCPKLIHTKAPKKKQKKASGDTISREKSAIKKYKRSTADTLKLLISAHEDLKKKGCLSANGIRYLKALKSAYKIISKP